METMDGGIEKKVARIKTENAQLALTHYITDKKIQSPIKYNKFEDYARTTANESNYFFAKAR